MRATIIEYHRLGVLNNRGLFTPSSEAGSLRRRGRQSWLLIRTLFLPHRWLHFLSVTAVKPKLVCPTHSEVKQTKTSEFGAGKWYKDQTRRMGGSCSEPPKLLNGCQKRAFKGKHGRGTAGCMAFFLLVGGEVTWWYSRNLSHHLLTLSSLKSRAYAQPEIAILTSDMHHLYGRKQRRTKESLDESEREEWKSWLKTQH